MKLRVALIISAPPSLDINNGFQRLAKYRRARSRSQARRRVRARGALRRGRVTILRYR